MSKKFFSLISGKDVKIAPKTKRVDAKTFSTLLNSITLLKEVQEDAQKFREETVSEIQKAKEEAQRAGFEEGFHAWVSLIAQQEQEIQATRKEFEKALIPVALKAAKKIVGREIQLSEDTIFDIVAASLKAVSSHRRITIYANKQDLQILEKNKTQLKTLFENLEVLSLRQRDELEAGSFTIETEWGIINARLDHKWDLIESAFSQLALEKGGRL